MQKPEKETFENLPGSGSASLSLEQISDEVLMRAIAGGETWALETLYQRYGRLLYSLVYRMIADRQVAEDLLQEAFLSIWQRAVSYSPQLGAVRSWLVSIVHHRTIDHLRYVRRRAVLKEATWEEAEQDEQLTFPDAWDETWRTLQSETVRSALMKISTEQRMMIELAYFQGWTQSEIAKGCSLPLGTVKARIRLGLIRLKRVLEEMGVYEL
jgi:RNA polymerase sigma-70 factor, ECF subfamily